MESRKYRLSLMALALLTIAWPLTCLHPQLALGYGELIAAVLGVLGLYFTGNVSNKLVIGKFPLKKEGEDNNGTHT